MTGPDWNERYKIGDLPWDTHEPDENLVNLLKSRTILPGKALEIGCGTGTDSIWLAHQGFTVLGTDISQVAIDMAKQKKIDKSLNCEFAVLDFIHENSLPASYDFVFDRGCFHSFDEEHDRSLFARHVSLVLKTNGIWASLIGSTEGAPRDVGPPRRTADEVVKAIEPYLVIVELRSVFFQTNFPSSAQAWLCIARQREEPAQPSTKR
jgi:SAM-dependent methyltransferase